MGATALHGTELVEQTGRPAAAAPWSSLATNEERRLAAWRRSAYGVWRLLPSSIQRLAVRVAAPKVSMAACAVIEDSRGDILVVRHPYRRQPWGLPGGFVRRGEQPESALRRELREELGVRAAVGALLFAEIDESGHHLTLCYRACVAGSLRLDGVELDGYQYVSAGALAGLFGAPAPAWIGRLEATVAA